MVEPADLRDRDNLSPLCLLHRSGNRCVRGETEVRPAPLVVLEVPSEFLDAFLIIGLSCLTYASRL